MLQYTPKGKDNKGNVVIFPARNTLFDDPGDALEWQLSQFLWYIPFGLSTAGILEFNAKEGKTDIPHVICRLGMLGDCAVIAGPIFDEANLNEPSPAPS